MGSNSLAAVSKDAGCGWVQRPPSRRAIQTSQPPGPPVRSGLPQAICVPSGLTDARTSLAGVDTACMPSMPNSARAPALPVARSKVAAHQVHGRSIGNTLRRRMRRSLRETAMSKHYAVFGHPVAHSLSPQIHAAFGRQVSIPIDYRAIDVEPGQFTHALMDFVAAGGAGANVTLPLKQAAFTLCDDLTERARRAGAVNTLVRNGDTWHGDNTDGVGLVRDLTDRHALDLRARRTLMLGAGGAARGVAPALLDAGIGDLFIVNRTPERTDQLADALAEPGRVHPRYLADLPALGEFDLIVNATSAGRDHAMFSLPRAVVGRR